MQRLVPRILALARRLLDHVPGQSKSPHRDKDEQQESGGTDRRNPAPRRRRATPTKPRPHVTSTTLYLPMLRPTANVMPCMNISAATDAAVTRRKFIVSLQPGRKSTGRRRGSPTGIRLPSRPGTAPTCGGRPRRSPTRTLSLAARGSVPATAEASRRSAGRWTSSRRSAAACGSGDADDRFDGRQESAGEDVLLDPGIRVARRQHSAVGHRDGLDRHPSTGGDQPVEGLGSTSARSGSRRPRSSPPRSPRRSSRRRRGSRADRSPRDRTRPAAATRSSGQLLLLGRQRDRSDRGAARRGTDAQLAPAGADLEHAAAGADLRGVEQAVDLAPLGVGQL